jgi:hypothetical protein
MVSLHLCFNVAFHLFLMALSVCPGRVLEIADQWLPMLPRVCVITRSSVSVHGSLQLVGSRWLCHLSLHCFAMRPGRWEAMKDHFVAVYLLTRLLSWLSSSGCHGPRLRAAF